MHATFVERLLNVKQQRLQHRPRGAGPGSCDMGNEHKVTQGPSVRLSICKSAAVGNAKTVAFSAALSVIIVSSS